MNEAKTFVKLLYVVTFFFVVFLIVKDQGSLKEGSHAKLSSNAKNLEFFKSWNDCARKIFNDGTDTPKTFWNEFAKRSHKCDEEAKISQELKIAALRNKDETKYALFPVTRGKNFIFVTLGIGLDIAAEQEFQQNLNKTENTVTFYGADPIVTGNSELYSKIGTYFPFAVGGKAGFSVASVYIDEIYKNLSVAHIDIYYFLKKVLPYKMYDYLWMDAEYAEYDMFDIFYRGERLDQEGIAFCQMSLEVHNANEKQQEAFIIYVRRLLEEKRFGFFLSEFVVRRSMSLRARPINLVLILVLIFLIIVLLYNQQPAKPTEPTEIRPNVVVFNKWSSCMKEKVSNETDHNIFWAKFQLWTDDCDKWADIDKLGLVALQNSDEVKYGLLPVEGDFGSANTLVTLGIGKDIDAEVLYKTKMNEIGRNLTFYGADPITDVNADLYANIGKYFPFAVGGDAGFSRASVLINGSYVNRDVVHVDLVYFLNRILKIKTYDNIWLDAEGAEYGLFDIFFKSGRLDEKGIRFCQMSLEVHQPNEPKKMQFMEMIKTIIKEDRYAMHKNRNVGHMRMFLFNFEDAYCVRKFLPKSLQNDGLTETQKKQKIFEGWSDCAQKQLDTYNNAEEFWLNFAPLTGNCDYNENIEKLGLVALNNNDEVKYAILPSDRLKNTTNTFVTLGIGKDISAEKLFRDELEKRGHTAKFYGADPISEGNADLYSQIGKYFPFAVSAKAGISKASVFINGSYVRRDVTHVELLYFLNDILELKEIDHLWLDAEGAEYGIFDFFYNDGPFEKNGISFCQMNLEVHIGSAERKAAFMKFAKRLAVEKRYAMLRSTYVSHIRLFLFNFGNPNCVLKYL
ncbi:unnamed protein product [Caenorhabditis sp. 36 PRJEB53466]|nr:unnamed protein product [Caenorhabditis sp. 36 PRJEB53466]